MDPNTGRLYPDLDAARLAGVENPIELRGRLEDVERISKAVAELHESESGSAKRRRKAIERRDHWTNKENN
jgi:hypothetical protein